MDLLEVINKIIQDNTEAQKLTDICIGTVTTADPIEIQINPNMPPLPTEALVLCDPVEEIEKDVEITPEFKAVLAAKEITAPDVIGKVKVSEALEEGDKVIMLRVLKGQQFIVLSRV